MSFLLAERARSECARSMRTVNDNLAAPSVDGGKAWIGAEGFLCSRNARPPKDGREWPDSPSCSRNAHDERSGMTPVLIPCSRSAHDQNVLARRPQWNQHGCHSTREKQASLEGSIRLMTVVRCAK